MTQWLSRFVEPTFRCYPWDPQRGRVSLEDGVRRRWGESLYMWDLNSQRCIADVFGRERPQRGRPVLVEPTPEQWAQPPPRSERRGRSK